MSQGVIKVSSSCRQSQALGQASAGSQDRSTALSPCPLCLAVCSESGRLWEEDHLLPQGGGGESEAPRLWTRRTHRSLRSAEVLSLLLCSGPVTWPAQGSAKCISEGQRVRAQPREGGLRPPRTVPLTAISEPISVVTESTSNLKDWQPHSRPVFDSEDPP